jgi:hypothetical protein
MLSGYPVLAEHVHLLSVPQCHVCDPVLADVRRSAQNHVVLEPLTSQPVLHSQFLPQ